MSVFGSSGVRGVVNQGFTPELAAMIGMAVGSTARRAVIGMDSRTSGPMVEAAVSSGLGNARRLLEALRAGKSSYHIIEVMACPGGCIGGGGQPRLTSDAVREARIRAIYAEDESRELRKSHENPDVKALYEEFLGEPLGHRAHELLHTEYVEKDRV